MSSQNDLITIMTVQKWAIKQNLFLVVIGYNYSLSVCWLFDRGSIWSSFTGLVKSGKKRLEQFLLNNADVFVITEVAGLIRSFLKSGHLNNIKKTIY
jgi:hypothetical protein